MNTSILFVIFVLALKLVSAILPHEERPPWIPPYMRHPPPWAEPPFPGSGYGEYPGRHSRYSKKHAPPPPPPPTQKYSSSGADSKKEVSSSTETKKVATAKAPKSVEKTTLVEKPAEVMVERKTSIVRQPIIAETVRYIIPQTIPVASRTAGVIVPRTVINAPAAATKPAEYIVQRAVKRVPIVTQTVNNIASQTVQMPTVSSNPKTVFVLASTETQKPSSGVRESLVTSGVPSLDPSFRSTARLLALTPAPNPKSNSNVLVTRNPDVQVIQVSNPVQVQNQALMIVRQGDIASNPAVAQVTHTPNHQQAHSLSMYPQVQFSNLAQAQSQVSPHVTAQQPMSHQQPVSSGNPILLRIETSARAGAGAIHGTATNQPVLNPQVHFSNRAQGQPHTFPQATFSNPQSVQHPAQVPGSTPILLRIDANAIAGAMVGGGTGSTLGMSTNQPTLNPQIQFLNHPQTSSSQATFSNLQPGHQPTTHQQQASRGTPILLSIDTSAAATASARTGAGSTQGAATNRPRPHSQARFSNQAQPQPLSQPPQITFSNFQSNQHQISQPQVSGGTPILLSIDTSAAATASTTHETARNQPRYHPQAQPQIPSPKGTFSNLPAGQHSASHQQPVSSGTPILLRIDASAMSGARATLGMATNQPQHAGAIPGGGGMNILSNPQGGPGGNPQLDMMAISSNPTPLRLPAGSILHVDGASQTTGGTQFATQQQSFPSTAINRKTQTANAGTKAGNTLFRTSQGTGTSAASNTLYIPVATAGEAGIQAAR